MNKEQILEGNQLIALFMGAAIEQDYCIIKDQQQDGLGFYFNKSNAPDIDLRYSSFGIKYHKSWNWLMPVVEKIESMFYSVNNTSSPWYEDETDTTNRNKIQYVVIISDRNHRIVINSSNYYLERDNKLIATWFAVVEFIKWYNNYKENE
jgi:hypothetical protein